MYPDDKHWLRRFFLLVFLAFVRPPSDAVICLLQKRSALDFPRNKIILT